METIILERAGDLLPPGSFVACEAGLQSGNFFLEVVQTRFHVR
jgi:hypothetical protein